MFSLLDDEDNLEIDDPLFDLDEMGDDDGINWDEGSFDNDIV